MKVAAMSAEVMTGSQPLITALVAANTDLQAKKEAALAARQASTEATAAMRAAAKVQRAAYGSLGNHVDTMAAGSDSYVLSTGYGVRATPAPMPALTEAPKDVSAGINGVHGSVTLGWKSVVGARNYEVQYTVDLTGATGWTSISETPGAPRANVGGLTSGTKYAFRVRALGNGQPGPYCGPVQQMAP